MKFLDDSRVVIAGHETKSEEIIQRCALADSRPSWCQAAPGVVAGLFGRKTGGSRPNVSLARRILATHATRLVVNTFSPATRRSYCTHGNQKVWLDSLNFSPDVFKLPHDAHAASLPRLALNTSMKSPNFTSRSSAPAQHPPDPTESHTSSCFIDFGKCIRMLTLALIIEL